VAIMVTFRVNAGPTPAGVLMTDTYMLHCSISSIFLQCSMKFLQLHNNKGLGGWWG
jgi:hypothetical protein